MKKIFLILCVMFLIPTCSSVYAGTPVGPFTDTLVKAACFSPLGGCTDNDVKEINLAKSEIYVHSYSFTSLPIATALHDACVRGVKIHGIFDKSNVSSTSSKISVAACATSDFYIDSKHAIDHNKVIIIDGNTVITGSFNFTINAERNNAENQLTINSASLASKYISNWKLHKAHSLPY